MVRDPLSRHNLGVGLPEGADVIFDGSVGYYCGGLNNGATIAVTRNAGWGTGEAMARGKITVEGYAGMSVGASMRGGVIHVRGDTGPRCGVAMKGGDIVVEGSVGFLTGFHGAHRPDHRSRADRRRLRRFALGRRSLGRWGAIKSLGVDSKVIEPEPEEVEAVAKTFV